MPAMAATKLLLLALPLALVQSACAKGCGKEPEPGASASSIAPSASVGLVGGRDAAAPPGWPMSPGLRRTQGIAANLLRSAHEVELSDDQKASVSKVEAAFLADEGNSMPAAMNAFQVDLAAGIRAGKLDSAKLAADYAAMDRAAAATQAREVSAIGALHDALPQAQRQALGAAVRARRAMRERLSPPSQADAGGPDWAKIRVDRLTRDLALDVDGGQQKQQLTALVGTNAKGEPQGPGVVDARREEGKEAPRGDPRCVRG